MRTAFPKHTSGAKAIKLIERGLPWTNVEELSHAFEVSLEKLASWLDIPSATLYRRKRSRRFTKQESDRLLRFARLWHLACDVFESQDGARKWLKSPQFGLRGAVPLEYAGTETGAREVENLLQRIDYGILA